MQRNSGWQCRIGRLRRRSRGTRGEVRGGSRRARGSLACTRRRRGGYAAAFVGAHRHAVVQLALVGHLDQGGLLRTRRTVARGGCERRVRLHLLRLQAMVRGTRRARQQSTRTAVYNAGFPVAAAGSLCQEVSLLRSRTACNRAEFLFRGLSRNKAIDLVECFLC